MTKLHVEQLENKSYGLQGVSWNWIGWRIVGNLQKLTFSDDFTEISMQHRFYLISRVAIFKQHRESRKRFCCHTSATIGCPSYNHGQPMVVLFSQLYIDIDRCTPASTKQPTKLAQIKPLLKLNHCHCTRFVSQISFRNTIFLSYDEPKVLTNC